MLVEKLPIHGLFYVRKNILRISMHEKIKALMTKAKDTVIQLGGKLVAKYAWSFLPLQAKNDQARCSAYAVIYKFTRGVHDQIRLLFRVSKHVHLFSLFKSCYFARQKLFPVAFYELSSPLNPFRHPIACHTPCGSKYTRSLLALTFERYKFYTISNSIIIANF